jgi:predicted dehydrogenase
MGRNHLRVLSMLNGVALKFVYDLSVEAANNAAHPFGVPVTADLVRALTEVDAVVICSPSVTHADYVRMVASHGVSRIFVEKPLANDLSECLDIATLVSRSNLKLQVGFIERYNPAVQSLKKILDGSKGVISVDFNRTNRVSTRVTDVDVISDLMIHDIDLALHLNGPVKAVSGYGVRHAEMIDLASALLAHANGRYSRIQASRITEKKIRSIQATCSDMYVDCDLLRKEIVINRESEVKQVEGEPYVITAIEEKIDVQPREALLLEVLDFVEFCKDERPILVPGAPDGVEAMRICEQIRAVIP